MIKEIIFLDDKDAWCMTDGEYNKRMWERFLRNVEKFICDLSSDDHSIKKYNEIKLCSYYQEKDITQEGEPWVSKLGIYTSINENLFYPEINFNENRSQKLINWLNQEIENLANPDDQEAEALIFCDYSWSCFSDEGEQAILERIWNTLKTKNNCILFYYTQVAVEGALNFIRLKEIEHDISCKLGNRVWSVPKDPVGNENDFIVAMANLYTSFCESNIKF